MLEINKIYNINCSKGLKLLNDNSVDCIVTSPPYWNLRNYRSELNCIWGGNSECKHEFELKEKIIKMSQSNEVNSPYRTLHDNLPNSYIGYCKKCGAWCGQLGLEEHPQEYINHIVEVCIECMRVLKPTGNFFLNLGDSYAHRNGKDEIRNAPKKSLKSNWFQEKQKLLIPHRIGISLQDRGFIIRDVNVWVKKLTIYPDRESVGSAMPFPAKDRFVSATEYIFHIVKSKKYYFNLENVKLPIKVSSIKRAKNEKLCYNNKSPYKSKEDGIKKYYKKLANMHDVIEANPTNALMFKRSGFSEGSQGHFSTFPKSLAQLFIEVGCPKGGLVLDPFAGSGTTLVVAKYSQRNFIGFEISEEYCEIIKRRLEQSTLGQQSWIN